MNLYSFAVFVFAICSVLIGVQVLVRRKDTTGVIYFFLSILYCIWGIGYALCTSGNLPYDSSLLAIRISNIAAAFIPIVWLHFCLFYTNRTENAGRFYLLMYLVPILVTLGSFSPSFISNLRPIVGFEYYPTPGFLYNIHTSIYFVVTPIGFYQLWKSIQELTGDDKKRQINFLIISFLGYLGGGLSFFPVYDIPIPQYGLFLLPLYPFGKAYFMISSGLFDEEQFAQAAHKNKLAALGVLTASINHEIRGPLFLMRGTVETENGPEAKIKLLNQIDRITGIVSRLTHFAKKGVDEAARIESLDLEEILTDIKPLFQHQLNYQHVEYSQEIAVDLPKIAADRRYLEEILFNLILNACQALKNTKDPQIKLIASRGQTPMRDRDRGLSPMASDSSSIVITIEDNGSGIPQDQIKNIFKPFHTTKTEGTGLGLYITKQLVEKCGGKIEVIADFKQGTTFRVSFKAEVNV